MSRYNKIFLIGFILWIAETAYFGFNAKPENGLESFLDTVSIILMAWGIIGDILSNVTIIKKTYARSNTTISNVEKFVVENPKVKLTNKEAKK